MIILVAISLNLYSQKVDTIIVEKAYTSHFSSAIKQPLFVTYTLFHYAGGCDRKGMDFVSDSIIKTAKDKDYKKSGYDKGHLVPAEDMASDCSKMLSTFKYTNCIPQSPKLNRGKWAQMEEEIRKMSYLDSIQILTGGSGYNKMIGDSVYVADKCWKMVKNLKTGKILKMVILTNSEEEIVERTFVNFMQFEKAIGYKIAEFVK